TLLLQALANYLHVEQVGVALTSPTDVELEVGFLSQPDVHVVPHEEVSRLHKEGLPMHALLVAAEVLSPSSGHHDRVRKRPYYQRHVPEYWIVDLDARLIERWRPGDERPQILIAALEWHPAGAIAPFRLELAPYFAAVFGEA